LITIDVENNWKRTALFRSYSKLGQSIHIIRGDSQDKSILDRVVRALGPRKLDLLVIDGDHSFAGVSRDFELYSKLVRRGGMVAIHDIIPDYRTRYGIVTRSYTGDVPRFWKTIKSKWKTQEFVESYEQDGCGIGVIYHHNSAPDSG
jgi:cephalosporin hydroxylase